MKLTNEAKNILIEAAGGNGFIVMAGWGGRNCINAGGSRFGIESDDEYALYNAALQKLKEEELVEPIGNRGEAFKLTTPGWQLADSLSKNPES